jgi:regulator of Ty1 transposition protein 109
MHTVLVLKDIQTCPQLACLRTMTFRDYLLVREFPNHVLVTVPVEDDSLNPYISIVPVYMPKSSSFLFPSSHFRLRSHYVSAVEGCNNLAPTTDCTILYTSKLDSTGQDLEPPPTGTLGRVFLC